MKEIVGQQYIIPKNSHWIAFDRDTLITLSKCPKMLVYFPKTACTPCSLKELKHWIPLLDSLTSDKYCADVVFIVNAASDNDKIIQILSELKFYYPIMFDEYGDFERYNLLPKNNMINTFILDKDNRVVMAGNPLIGDKVWKVFEMTLKRLS